jgi:hypothetical protein
MMTSAVDNALSVLSTAQLQQYEAKGFLIVRGLFTEAEIGAIAAEADALLARQDLIDTNNLCCRWQPHRLTGECLFEAFDPVIDIGPACARLAAHHRLLAVLADLYGEEPCLFKDKLIFKPPGARGYDLHQDYISWAGFPRSFVTALIAIDQADEANGCTEVFPVHHLRGYLSPEDGNYHPLPMDAVNDTNAICLTLGPGDAAFFGCFLPHRSQPNQSERWRRQLYLSYNAQSDGGCQREQHYHEFQRWLRQRYAEHGKHTVYFR